MAEGILMIGISPVATLNYSETQSEIVGVIVGFSSTACNRRTVINYKTGCVNVDLINRQVLLLLGGFKRFKLLYLLSEIVFYKKVVIFIMML